MKFRAAVVSFFLAGSTLVSAQQTLTVSVVAGAMRDTLTPLARQFEQENPGVRVNLVPEPEGGSFEALIAAGNQPDLLITSFGGQIGRLASQDVVAPLEDFEGAEELLGRSSERRRGTLRPYLLHPRRGRRDDDDLQQSAF